MIKTTSEIEIEMGTRFMLCGCLFQASRRFATCWGWGMSFWNCVPETSDGLLEDVFIQALVKDVGEGSNGGTPGHGKQVMVVAAGWQAKENTLRCGPTVEQHTPYIILLHQPCLLIRHHNLFISTGGHRSQLEHQLTQIILWSIPQENPFLIFNTTVDVTPISEQHFSWCLTH